jgi:hypothetical protein
MLDRYTHGQEAIDVGALGKRLELSLQPDQLPSG